MELDVLLLSRLQFAFTVMFHYLFPPLSIGLGAIMVVIEWMRMRDGGEGVWDRAARFWTRIFALNFAMGVTTGIVMEFEFGTNWAVYSRFVGDVFGSALAAEAIFAFFLESGFLAVLVFGWERVGPRMHFFSALMVALGSAFSAIWIVVANSWQQTPAGYHIVEQTIAGTTHYRAEITDFWAMVFNPSSMHRLTHVYIGCLILGSFFVLSVSAYYILKRRHLDVARRSFKIALVIATAGSLAALVQGHAQAKNVAEHQPSKLAAFEAHFETGEGGTPLILFGIPDAEKETVHVKVAIPSLLSLLIYEDPNRPVPGLDQVPSEDRPPILLPFLTYRLMIGIGFACIGLTLAACVYWWRGTLFEQRWLLWLFVIAVVGPYLANQAGWVTAEVGRQPWIVWPSVQDGVEMRGLRTEDALSETLAASQVLWSICMFGAIYLLLAILWIYVMNAKIHNGPDEPSPTGHRVDRSGGMLATDTDDAGASA